MTKLSSADLREQIISTGVEYVPSEQVFYKNFPYKIELSPKFKGLGGVSGRKGCQIDIGNPAKARQDLAKFNERMDKIISNVEYRHEIRDFVALLPEVEYKTRMGGENNLFYFRDSNTVLVVVKRYKDVINSVTGPISTAHEDVIEEHNIVMRDRLYYGRFRYMIQFDRSKDFVETTAERLLETLNGMDSSTWRAHKLVALINYVKRNGSINTPAIIPPPPFPKGIFTHFYSSISPPRSVMIYLTNPQDYVYIKMMTGEYIVSSYEVMLFDELT